MHVASVLCCSGCWHPGFSRLGEVMLGPTAAACMYCIQSSSRQVAIYSVMCNLLSELGWLDGERVTRRRVMCPPGGG